MMFLSKIKLTRLWISLIGLLASLWFCDSVLALRGGPVIWPSDAYSKQKTYRTPEGAVQALVEALGASDEKKLSVVLGPVSKRAVTSGNKDADQAERERFLQAYQEKNEIVKVSGKKAVLKVGNEAWTFPVPIVESGKHWHFSAKHVKGKIFAVSERQK